MSVAESQGTSLDQFTNQIKDLKRNLESVIRGKGDVIDQLLVSVLAGESVLVEDVPGVGKTTLAKALAASLELNFQRIQCTPDLLPSDVFGTSVFNPQDGSFKFRPGPIFCNVLLVDEINRASPRTQSALLEAMGERQVTVEGTAHRLEPPFLVIATQNPLGFHGTFPLPESQLDRFLMQISMDYPDRQSELEILFNETRHASVDLLKPVLSRADLLLLQDSLKEVRFDKSLADYLLKIVESTRTDSRVELGCSPRGSIKLFKAAQAMALVNERNYVLPDDIQKVAANVLKHRIVMKRGSTQGTRNSLASLIKEIIDEIDVPV